MSKRIYNGEQIEQLSKNRNVAKCSERSIAYSRDFKIRAVKLYEQGSTPTEIFTEAGFDLRMVGRKKPKECLSRWTRFYRTKGIEGLIIETRGRNGGRPKTKNLSDAENIKRLEAKVAYLKAENDFLAKLRAKRAE
mgnify:CR=1 FL=1